MDSQFHFDAQKSMYIAVIIILAALALIPATHLKAPDVINAPAAQTGLIATDPELKVAFIGDSGNGTS